MRKLLRCYKPDLVFVYETHTGFAGTKKFWNKESYETVALEEVHGHSGGVWALKNTKSGFYMSMLESTPHCISVTISHGRQFWICTGVYASPVYSLSVV